jgi:uncharacterized membrane protein (UPF0127 family)
MTKLIQFFLLMSVPFFQAGAETNSNPITRQSSPATIVFEQKKIELGSHKLIVEIADTDPKRQRGLMFREKLEEGRGMLFIFPEERVLNFWMKNTFIPLSIGYFNKEKKLITIKDMKPVKSEIQTDLPGYSSEMPAMFALEVPLGWFEKNKISKGAQLKF